MESVLREIHTCNKQNKTPETKERTPELTGQQQWNEKVKRC